MKLVANGINKQYLRSCLPPSDAEIDGVSAAIAYGDDSDTLIKNCLENKFRLDIWMRYDETVPVKPALLQHLLNNLKNNVFCHLIPDMLHAKIIWWRGHGAYIGSSNLTGRGWYSNIETGMFFSEGDLIANDLIPQLEVFFDEIANLEQAMKLNQRIIDEQQEFLNQRRKSDLVDIEKNARGKRELPVFEGIDFKDDKKTVDKRKERFRIEWQSAIAYIDHIASLINDYRPMWIHSEVPVYWQVDQFLHAYYFKRVKQPDNTYPVEDFHVRHKPNPEAALKTALQWWKVQTESPSSEDDMLDVSAPTLSKLLSKEKLLSLTLDEIEQVCWCTNATLDHIIKVKAQDLGKPNAMKLSKAERVPLFAKLLMSRRNSRGEDIRQVLNYVLYSGKPQHIWERIYTAGKTDDFRLSHYGINSIAEVVGWAQPESTPPRNSRTNKSLRALGYPIKINM